MTWDPYNSHVVYPPWVNPLAGHTAELPSAIALGQRAQQVYSHLVNWRMNGVVLFVPYQTTSTARNDATGNYRIITYSPELAGGQDRQMALFYGVHGVPAAAAYSLAYVDPNDAGNNKTLQSGTLGTTTYPTDVEEHVGVIDYAETANANGFDQVRLVTTNYVLAYLTGVHVPRAALIPDQVEPKFEEVGPSEVIAYLDRSYRGLIEKMYDEGDLVFSETAERMTRRCFWNHSQSGYNRGSNIVAYSNIYDEMTFPAVCRDLYSTQGTRYCYPAAIIQVSHASNAHGIRFRSTVTGNTWTYTVQAGDPVGTPFLVTYNRTGASNPLGLPIVVENDGTYPNGDLIVVEGLASGSGHTTDVYADGLWEGAA